MIAYVDCFCGVAGDMLLGALVDAGAPLTTIRKRLSTLPVRGYKIRSSLVMRGAVRCRNVDVRVPHQHKHASASGILRMIRDSRLSKRVRESATAVFTSLAKAEGKVHGIDPGKVTFHEVGAVDSIVDIVGACIALDLLDVDELGCSPIPMSRGSVETAHGLIPVPGPATLELLKGFPLVHSGIDAEIVTPTGAAILSALVRRPGVFPDMRLKRTGYGAGDYNLPKKPDFLRVLVGERATATNSDVAVLMETNLDDLPGEDIGYLYDSLFQAGALDVFSTPVQMKKSRPAILLSVLAPPSHTDAIEHVLLRETTTFGVRRRLVERTKLDRRTVRVKTKYGRIRVKIGSLNGSILKASPEYEDLRAAARKHDAPLSRVRDAAMRAYDRS